MIITQVLDFVIKLFILGAVPWIFLSKENTLYFKVKGLKLSVVFNCFASLLGSSIYICLYYSKSPQWQNEMVFFYSAIPCAILYFIILLSNYEFVEEEGKKDLYFEIKKFEGLKNKTEDQIKIYKELKTKRNKIKIIVVLHFILYVAVFTLLAFGLGVNSILQFRTL